MQILQFYYFKNPKILFFLLLQLHQLAETRIVASISLEQN